MTATDTTTQHALTETRAAELWDTHRDPSAAPFHSQGRLYRRGQTALIRAAFDAGREHEREHAHPHADPRPWQDCTAKDIREGDRVEAQDSDRLIVGVAHHQYADGDWCTEGGYHLTWGDRWHLRRIPAPTPPAEEVTLPTEHPAHLTDVEAFSGVRCAHMALDFDGYWVGVDQNGLFRLRHRTALTAFTLPDGTRARRDGKYEDGSPRFIKVQEGEK